MNEDLEQLLLNLKLRPSPRASMRCSPPRPKRYAGSDSGDPVAARRVACPPEKALQSRIDRADFPKNGPRVVPFKLQKGVKERQIRTFAELDFIPKAENIVFIGETGVGKTGLMISLARKACRTAIGPCLSRRRICSMKCTHRSPTDRRVGC